MNVPFVDLRAQHDEIRLELDTALREAVDESSFVGGPFVEAFERQFAAYCGSQFALGCASGTDALKLALMAAGVKPGDAVITVPHTFIATVEAITLVGAWPAFVDIDLATYTMSPVTLAEYVEANCRCDDNGRLVDKKTGLNVAAILPVHLYGLPADMSVIWAMAAKYRLKIIEDACQAHGAVYVANEGDVRKTGTLGDVAAFSFYPSKNLGAMGEAGAVTANNQEMIEKMSIWRDHGQGQRYTHVSPDGWNGRLDAIQAAILAIKLRKLDEWNERRRQVADWYRQLLSGDERITLPVEPAFGRHVYHLFVVRIPNRDRVREQLAESGIGTALHYPVSLHLQEAYRHLGFSEGAFPESEAAASSILSLPMHPHLTESQVECVSMSLCESLNR